MRECTCGSSKYGERQYDARGIYLCMTCEDCHAGKMKMYRPEVLNNPNYDCDEQIEPDDCYPPDSSMEDDGCGDIGIGMEDWYCEGAVDHYDDF